MTFPCTSDFKVSDASKTVWLFGAGASSAAPYNLPVQDKLLEHFCNMPAYGKPETKEEFMKLKQNVIEACETILPGADPKECSLEELFSAYEIQAQAGWATDNLKNKASESIGNLRNMLIKTTKTRGRGDAVKWRPHDRADQHSPYAELLEKLFPLKCADQQIRAHVLATMNYDINLDRCLINMRDKKFGGIDLDYGVDFADYRIPGHFVRPSERAALLLRLHGGLNWKRCMACQSLFTTISSHANVLDREICRICGSTRLDYVIVHPSFIRNYSDPVLQIIWGRLLEVLRNSDRWIFIGYSLPLADINLRVVLRRALNMRTEASQDSKILWVGKRNDKNDPAWKAIGNRFENLFGNQVLAWENAENGFSGFVDAI
jgi:hypothetical protein